MMCLAVKFQFADLRVVTRFAANALIEPTLSSSKNGQTPPLKGLVFPLPICCIVARKTAHRAVQGQLRHSFRKAELRLWRPLHAGLKKKPPGPISNDIKLVINGLYSQR